MKKILGFLLIALMFSSMVYAEENVNTATQSLRKPGVTEDIWMDANRMSGVFRNNGVWYYDYATGDWGLEWPKNSGNSTIFGAGQWITARVDGTLKTAAVIHSASEYQPGSINADGTAANPTDPAFQWYELYPKGVGDWGAWPVADQGAPLDAAGDPLLIGDKTAFSVWNDLGEHSTFSTGKLGVEVRQLAFQFNRADAIGDMTFIKWQMINKSGTDWDSTYFSIWSDPDVGDGMDDLVGSDPALGLGYCYNGTNEDQNYGAAPPAVGIDFFQGPLIANPDSTVILPDGTVIEGKEMLKMTAFIYYNNDDSNQGNPDFASDVWNYQRGFWRDNSPILDPNGVKNPFMYDGDPETATGWLDSDEADRRFLMTTGPFTMEAWVDENGDGMPTFGEPGVQEIVAGVINARGATNLNSVSVLKAIDEAAQNAYNIDFALPSPPAAPEVVISELPNEVILTWGDESEFNEDGTPYSAEDLVANSLVGQNLVVGDEYKVVNDGFFNFARYSVFQFSDGAGSDPVLIAQFGANELIDPIEYAGQRYMRITENKHSLVGNVGDKLINGKEYYFGVRAEAYLEFAKPDQFFNSPVTLVNVTPHFAPGARYNAAFQDTLELTKGKVNADVAAGDGSALAYVADPSKLTGHDYAVEFVDVDDGHGGTTTDWQLKDVTTGELKLSGMTNQTGNDAYPVVDGLIVKVIGPAPGISAIVELDADGNVFDTNLWGSLNNYGRSQSWPVFVVSGTSDLEFSSIDRFGTMTPKDYEIIFTADDSTLAWEYYTDGVLKDAVTGAPEFLPFVLNRIDLDGTKTRLAVTILDAGNDGSGTWNRSWAGIFGTPGFEPLYVYDNAEYKPEDLQSYLDAGDGTVAPGYGPWGVAYPAINRLTINMYYDVDGHLPPEMLDADGVCLGPPAAGTHIKIITTKPNTPNDVFSFTAPAGGAVTDASQKEDIEKINVVPNPYYGYHSGEADAFDRWVQFTYLPEKCTIRIFDIAGNLLRVLEKDDASTTYLRWDMKNAYAIPVASGIYVYHVDTDMGEKVGKLAIIAPNERLDTY